MAVPIFKMLLMLYKLQLARRHMLHDIVCEQDKAKVKVLSGVHDSRPDKQSNEGKRKRFT